MATAIDEFDSLPPEIAAEVRNLSRRQRIADMLLQQGQQPMVAPQVKGRFSVPISPLQGVAKMFNAYTGRTMGEDVAKQYEALGKRYTEGKTAAQQKVLEAMTGTPDTGGTPVQPELEDPTQGATSFVEGKKGDITQAIMMAATDPYLRGDKSMLGAMTGVAKIQAAKDQLAAMQAFNADQRAADRQARLDAIEAAAREGRITREDADRRRADEAKIARQENAANRELQIRLAGQVAAASRQPPTPIVQTDETGRTRIYDRAGNLVRDLGQTGKQSAGHQKAEQAKRKSLNDIDATILELEQATADGGLIDQSTGSGAGALVDMAAGFFGKATPGAIAAGRMKPIYDMALKMVPRFEGPQSDKDTKSYADAAGQLANPSVPNAQKKEAGKEILRLMKARRGQFVSADVQGDIDAGGGGGAALPTPAGIDPKLWAAMTPEERALWK